MEKASLKVNYDDEIVSIEILVNQITAHLT